MSGLLGGAFETAFERRKRIAWDKTQPIIGFNPAVWRYDAYNNVIRWSDYGDRNSDYGWEIDHRVPTALGGIDTDSNCRALHWRVNAGLGGLLSGLRRT